MSLIESKIDVIKLAKDIRSGALPTVQVDLDQFFTKTFGGEWVPDPDTRIQVRETVRDANFVNRIVNKIQASGDSSAIEPLTCIKMPDGSLKIGNGSHTAEIGINVGLKKIPSYIVDWEKDLGGKTSSAQRLGNLLNFQTVEKVSVHISERFAQHL